jgi:DNA-binding FadR family transcriptional regulator
MSDQNAKITLEEKILDIIVGRLESGEKLPPEKKLAIDLGVSRTALREVLSAFEASGIVVALQGSGRYVQMPDVSNQITDGWNILLRAKPALLLELLEIRKVMELGFLTKAIERLDIKNIQIMRELVEEMKKKAEDGEDFVNEDQEFHRLLFSSTGNILLEQLLKAFWDLYEQSNVPRNHTNLSNAAFTHQQMLEAIIRNNTDQAAVLLKEQFADARYQISMYLS